MNLHIYMKCGKCKKYTLPVFESVSATSTTMLDMRNWLSLADKCPGCQSKNWQLCIEPEQAVVDQVVESEVTL